MPCWVPRSWLYRLRLNWPSLLQINTVEDTGMDFKAEFPTVCQEGLGTVNGLEADIRLKEDATPR